MELTEHKELKITFKVLFIAWDGPYATYLESLFLPIFISLKKYGYEFHIIQFSWANAAKVENVKGICETGGVFYMHIPVFTKPHPVIGKVITLRLAKKKIVSYVKKHGIEVLMPRALMPSGIILRVLKDLPAVKVVLDADGLQIEERVEFADLREGSFRYRQLKKIESAIIKQALVVITRSFKASDLLLQQYGENMRSKFFCVINGRDENVFKRSSESDIHRLREELGIPQHAFVSVYCGSLTAQYGLSEMAILHKKMLLKNADAYWLVLTGNTENMKPYAALPHVIVRNVPAVQVPMYLSVANVGLALRKATRSMKGVAPIKIGEYLLMGLPVIASCGIGDSEEILTGNAFCHMVPDLSESNIEKAFQWMSDLQEIDPEVIRQFGIANFGLEAAVESYRLALDAIK
jgi:glycosyltransferase involved in cell wall biosynthesis